MIIPFIICIIIFLVDRITKQIALSNLITGKSITIIKNFFYITLAKNKGVAFNLLESKLVFIIIMTIIILFLLIKLIKNKNNNTRQNISYALVIAGALGNLYDRLIYGYVIDFLDFKIINYNYPIFNIADTSIVIGVILLLILDVKKEG